MKVLFILIPILFCININAQNRLERAYEKKSTEMLMEVFEDWVSYSEPIEKNELDRKFNFEKYAYEIFEDFYTPKNLSRIGKSEWGNNLYKNIKYAFIQNEVIIEIYNNFLSGNNKTKNEKGSRKPPEIIFPCENYYQESVQRLKLIDFRPRVKIPGAKIIYLNERIKQDINVFLKIDDNELSNNNLMSPAKVSEESEQRLSFINKYTKIFSGHWGGYWQIETDPTIMIRFNKDYTKAEVCFTLVYEGGTAYYERINGKWKFKKSSITWIQ